MNSRNRYIVMAFLTGAFSLFIQIFYFRFALSVFRGNELILGICMFHWLMGVSGGAVLARKLTQNQFNFLLPPGCFLIAAGGLFLIGNRYILDLPPFVTSPFAIVVLVTFTAFFPPCLLFGAVYTFISRSMEETYSEGAIRIYWVEAFGSILAGIGFSLIISFLRDSSHLFFWIIAAYFLISITLLSISYKIVWFVLTVLSLAITQFVNPLHFFEGRLYPGMTVTKSFDTPYQRCFISRYETQSNLHGFDDIILSSPVSFAEEEKMLLPLVVKRNPRSALYMGLFTKESLRFARSVADTIKIVYHDQRLLQEARNGGLSIPDNVVISDEKTFLANQERHYELIQMNVPEPISGAECRFFTMEFFSLVKKRLSANGLFVFSLPGAENRMSEIRGKLYFSILRTLQIVFSDVRVIWGSPTHFLASQEKIIIDPDILMQRMMDFPEKPIFFTPSHLMDKLSDFRQSFYFSTIETRLPPRENYDLYPSSYRYTQKIWFLKSASRAAFSGKTEPIGLVLLNLVILSCFLVQIFLLVHQGVFRKGMIITFLALLLCLNILNILKIIPTQFSVPAIVGIFYLFSIISFSKETFSFQSGVGLKLFSIVFFSGFVSMGIQMIIVCLFQILAGNLYWMIALLFAIFMAGLTLGCLSIEYKKPVGKYPSYLTIVILIFSILFLLNFYSYLSRIFLTVTICFIVALNGIFAGYMYSLAQKSRIDIYPSSSPGILYAGDSFGAALSALIITAFIVPALGFPVTLLGLGILALSGICVPLYLIQRR